MFPQWCEHDRVQPNSASFGGVRAARLALLFGPKCPMVASNAIFDSSIPGKHAIFTP